MELKIIHFYPDLMSLYGSYANVSVLRRYLEALGCAVTVQAVVPGEGADITGADFLFMGAGTERAQRFAAEDFARYGAAVKAAAEDGTAMLFARTAACGRPSCFLQRPAGAVRIQLQPQTDAGKRDHGGHCPENGPGSGCKPLPGLILFRIA